MRIMFDKAARYSKRLLVAAPEVVELPKKLR